MRSSITSSRNLIILALTVVLAALGTAAAQTYGTVVDDAWYETVARAYQNPPSRQSNNVYIGEWAYESAYPTLELDIDVTGLNQVEYVAPSRPGSADCTLIGTARLAERLMRDRVQGLRNLVGPDSGEFRETILAMGRDQLVEFQTSRILSTDWLPAAALADGLRYEPEYFTESRGQYISTYRVYFSLTALQELGVIVDGTLTITSGVAFDDVCRFDLNDLP